MEDPDFNSPNGIVISRSYCKDIQIPFPFPPNPQSLPHLPSTPSTSLTLDIVFSAVEFLDGFSISVIEFVVKKSLDDGSFSHVTGA